MCDECVIGVRNSRGRLGVEETKYIYEMEVPPPRTGDKA
jgi:hypothetical protein